jgi:hypothetical protein
VLKQVKAPKLVACDTMNFWIESRRPDLLELLKHVDLITLNDGEARQLTECANLVQAARWIMDGPADRSHQEGRARRVHVQQGRDLPRPGVSARVGVRPDRVPATRSPAASWAGSPAPTTSAEANMRRAVIVGSAMGSFVVEGFSITRLLEVTRADIERASPSSTGS